MKFRQINPYAKPPTVPTVALLNSEGVAVDEFGSEIDFDNPPKNTKVYCSYDTARLLSNRGIGEVLCWNGEEIKWRHKYYESDGKWDAFVLRTPFPKDDCQSIKHLGFWRDWLAEYRAAPTGTTGSAAWSLLRATIKAPLLLNRGAIPPFDFTMGGRIEMGSNGAGRYEGDIHLLDMPSAYANVLGNIRYGGSWRQTDRKDIHKWNDRPVFVRATVRIPEMMFGPLVNRPEKKATFIHLVAFNYYPRKGEITNVWTIEELVSAEILGVKILRIHEVWVQINGVYPFVDWLSAILDGRKNCPGFSKNLVKLTGNALWGRFAMDGENGKKIIRSKNKSTKEFERKRVLNLGGIPADHALAETVSGRVRALIGSAMLSEDNRLISAHTDGIWTYRNTNVLSRMEGKWREKHRASRIDVISPQSYRYWPSLIRKPTVVFAGFPPTMAEEAFEKHWERYQCSRELIMTG